MKATKGLFNNELSLSEVLRFTPSLVCNFFSVFFNKKSFCGPAFISWVLTDQCQCKCKHCHREPIPASLSKEARFEIAGNIAKSSAHWVSLIGGEPLIIPEIIDIARILKKNNKKVTITTNGLDLDHFLKDIIDLRIDAVHISVDSHRREIHDYLRDTPGLFDKVLKTISEIRLNRKSAKPLIKLRCTISKANYLGLVDYIEFWKDKVDAIHFQPIVDNRMNRIRDGDLMLTKEDEGPFCGVLSELQKRYSFLRNNYYTFMPEFIFNRQALYKRLNYKCLLVASSGLYLLPDGRVTICYGRREDIAGNAINKSIIDIWRDKETMSMQRRIVDTLPDSFCPECFCWETNTPFNLYFLSLYNYLRKIIK